MHRQPVGEIIDCSHRLHSLDLHRPTYENFATTIRSLRSHYEVFVGCAYTTHEHRPARATSFHIMLSRRATIASDRFCQTCHRFYRMSLPSPRRYNKNRHLIDLTSCYRDLQSPYCFDKHIDIFRLASLLAMTCGLFEKLTHYDGRLRLRGITAISRYFLQRATHGLSRYVLAIAIRIPRRNAYRRTDI